MFPFAALAALSALAGFAGYQYSKAKHNNSKLKYKYDKHNENYKNTDSVAKNVNTYNYYTNESENGNTLFNSQKKTKRTLFGGESV